MTPSHGRAARLSVCVILPLLVCLHAPVTRADLGPGDLGLAARDFEVSQPVSLTGLDRIGADPLAAPGGEYRMLEMVPRITIYVSMRSNWLNSTERQSIFNTITARYSFASTLINFTTVQPTTGSYHVLDISPGDDPLGRAFGRAPGPTATVFAGRYTVRRSTWFSSTQSRVNAIGETAAHELDHILRGRGHTSTDPNDLNASGSLVPYTRRAQDDRHFSTPDQAQKIRNIEAGVTFTPYDARDADERCGCHFIYGHDPNQIVSEPDDPGVNVVIQMSNPEFRMGLMTVEGPWDFSNGMDPPGEYSIVIPGGAVVDWTLIHVQTGEFFPISEHGIIILDPTSTIDPIFSVEPPVTGPYHSHAQMSWEIEPYGVIDADLRTFHEEGFQLGACVPISVERELRGFNAIGAPGAVLLSWVVLEPGEAVAFDVYRSYELDGDYTRLTERSISSRAEEYPATITYEDATARPGRTAYYRLDVTLLDGTVERWPMLASAAALPLHAVLQLSLSTVGAAPASELALLSLAIPGVEDQAKLAVYDVNGRHVATLVEGEIEGGIHQVAWDLRDASGRKVPVGVYFARLETSTGGARSTKIVVLR